jgi:hypothetical protein
MDNAERMIKITHNIKKSQKVNGFNTDEINEAGTIAHGLLDIEESLNAITHKFLPLLSSENISEEQVDDVLFDIGEELRHILYHIKDMRYYNYLKE